MGDFRVLKPRWETASNNDSTFFQGIDATMGDVTADPLEPALLPWDNYMGRGQIDIQIHRHRDYLTNSVQRCRVGEIYIYIYAYLLWTFSPSFRSLAYTVWEWRCFEDVEEKLNEWINELMAKVFVEQPWLHRVSSELRSKVDNFSPSFFYFPP